MNFCGHCGAPMGLYSTAMGLYSTHRCTGMIQAEQSASGLSQQAGALGSSVPSYDQVREKLEVLREHNELLLGEIARLKLELQTAQRLNAAARELMEDIDE